MEDTTDDPNAAAVDDPNMKGELELPAVDENGLAGELSNAPKAGLCPVDSVPGRSNKTEGLATKPGACPTGIEPDCPPNAKEEADDDDNAEAPGTCPTDSVLDWPPNVKVAAEGKDADACPAETVLD